MPRPILLILPLLVGTASCDRQPNAPVTEETPSLNWMNNRDNGNIRIQRYQDIFAFSWTDPRSGLRATHTTFPIPFMGAPEPDCGPQSAGPMLDIQDVGLFNELDEFSSQIRRNLKGPVWVIIRDVTQAGTCYGVKLIAEGPGEIHLNDNDVFGVGPEASNSNAWGFGATGTLTKVGGGVVKYAGHARFTVTGLDENGDAIFKHEQFFINLR